MKAYMNVQFQGARNAMEKIEKMMLEKYGPDWRSMPAFEYSDESDESVVIVLCVVEVSRLGLDFGLFSFLFFYFGSV